VFKEEFEGPGPQDETAVRAQIEALEAQRVSLVDAHVSLARSLAFRVLMRIGQPVFAWLNIVLLGAGVVIALALRSWQIALLWLIPTAVLWIYEMRWMDEWVAAHDRKIDAAIRELLAAAGAADDGTT
jgi:hypothetical protein